jgi:hypothetical protein
MDDSLEAFHNDFFQDILAGADAEQQFKEDQFFEVVSAELVEAGELDSADREYYSKKARKNDMRVDGYGGDPAGSDGVLTLIISDFQTDSKIISLTNTDMLKVFKRLRSFLENSLEEEFRDGLPAELSGHGLATLISLRWDEINKIRLILITNKVLSSRVDGAPDDTLFGRPVSHNVWDLSRLAKYSQAGNGREEIEIDLVGEFGGSLPVLPAATSDDSYDAYLTVIPARQLAAIYDRWGTRLLEQNVRVFLQARGGVNKGIRSTLINEPGMFFAYNNGLTATAEGIEIEKNSEGLEILSLRNLQIVNGGQTTASIHAVIRKSEGDLSQVSVQMKLSIIDPIDVEKLVPKISQFANTQNKVNPADFFANSPFHVRIEGFSRRIWARSTDGGMKDTKWFYERARGQYQDARALLTGSARKKFDLEFPNKAPNRQLVVKTDLAKYLMAWRGEPHIVSLGAQKNFAKFAVQIGKEWEKDPQAFHERFYKHAIAKAIIFRKLDSSIQRARAESVLEAEKLNLVPYSIAKLDQMISEAGQVLDFDKVWNTQSVSAELEKVLLECAAHVDKVLMTLPPGSTNKTEWAKQQACWKRVQDLKLELPKGLRGDLLSQAEEGQREADAQTTQAVAEGLEVQTEALDIEPEAWEEFLGWCEENMNPSPNTLVALRTCASVKKIANPKQSALALKALGEGIAQGYVATPAPLTRRRPLQPPRR